MWDLIFNNYLFFLLVITRITAMILFNPIFGRRNIPTLARMGLILFLSIIIMYSIDIKDIQIVGLLDFIFIALKELIIGFSIGFLIQLALSTIMMTGDISDMQIGVAMSKLYDPHSNISMSITGSIYFIIFTLIFFLSNAHLNFIKIINLSFDIVPVGFEIIDFNFAGYIVDLFGSILVIAIKLSLPVFAVEFIGEIGMGILMRTVPQINVFVVGLQLKLLIGLVMIALILPVSANIFDNLIASMFDRMHDVLGIIA